MNQILLGVGDYGVTNKPGSALKTLALGSCVAVIIMDANTRTIGMDHIALPDSSINQERAKEKPGYFSDTGIVSLLRAMRGVGANVVGPGVIIKLVGGANVMDTNGTFNIGKRNVLAIKKNLWRFKLGPVAEDVGGKISRTVTVDVDTGRVIITSPGRDPWEI